MSGVQLHPNFVTYLAGNKSEEKPKLTHPSLKSWATKPNLKSWAEFVGLQRSCVSADDPIGRRRRTSKSEEYLKMSARSIMMSGSSGISEDDRTLFHKQARYWLTRSIQGDTAAPDWTLQELIDWEEEAQGDGFDCLLSELHQVFGSQQPTESQQRIRTESGVEKDLLQVLREIKTEADDSENTKGSDKIGEGTEEENDSDTSVDTARGG